MQIQLQCWWLKDGCCWFGEFIVGSESWIVGFGCSATVLVALTVVIACWFRESVAVFRIYSQLQCLGYIVSCSVCSVKSYLAVFRIVTCCVSRVLLCFCVPLVSLPTSSAFPTHTQQPLPPVLPLHTVTYDQHSS